jgi:Asp-tRNA(Asn)/Glu-tRNA(Gln) amidotransferase A subunit family amidase
MTNALDLIAAINQLETRFAQAEPEIQAFVPEPGRFERLRSEAQALLEHWPDEEKRPPLFGVFLGVKDIFHTDGFPTRAGSQVPAELLTGPEARSVRALREAGALVVGKTVTTEFAYFAPGPTRNPHNPAHTPGGSSSGSAAAVSAGLCALALGTQTIGSINRPAAFCGVLGYKPSYDRISRDGVIPLSPSLDHVGLFAADLQLLVTAASRLARNWQASPTGRPVLGIPQGPYLDHADAEGRAHFDRICQVLADEGFSLKTVDTMPDFDDISVRHRLILAVEAEEVHRGWHSSYGDRYHEKTSTLLASGRVVSANRYETALLGRLQLRQEFEAQMDAAGIDLWLSPSAPGAAPRGIDSTGDPIMNLPWTHAGLPTLTMPAGSNSVGLPLGLQMAGRWYGDEKLLSFASSIEPALGKLQ